MSIVAQMHACLLAGKHQNKTIKHKEHDTYNATDVTPIAFARLTQ